MRYEAVKLSLSTAPGDPRVARAGTALHITPRLLCGEVRGAPGGTESTSVCCLSRNDANQPTFFFTFFLFFCFSFSSGVLHYIIIVIMQTSPLFFCFSFSSGFLHYIIMQTSPPF